MGDPISGPCPNHWVKVYKRGCHHHDLYLPFTPWLFYLELGRCLCHSHKQWCRHFSYLTVGEGFLAVDHRQRKVPSCSSDIDAKLSEGRRGGAGFRIHPSPQHLSLANLGSFPPRVLAFVDPILK